MGTPLIETEDYRFYQDPRAEYALVDRFDGSAATSCQGNSQAGNIVVTCTVDKTGTLTVHENAWSGWQAWVDGKRTPLLSTQWLSVEALPGTHTYQFRYLPLDVLLGLLVTLAGIVLSILIQHRNR